MRMPTFVRLLAVIAGISIIAAQIIVRSYFEGGSSVILLLLIYAEVIEIKEELQGKS